ncbi:hypothetical protein EKH79_16545 [Dyella dinghuensis]|uniref:Uncharacterized protein n=1 Tax=Dyella dinghuensis TaxID=1920169 RepID=A0A432LQM1_9GAMM|nr:hypothetical protein [Dyella dinghuensis]RUL62476.1 hypothetical protein EKH79_16545 [Dyella dinghuensis]
MNHTPQPPRNEAEEREWLMQERAAEAGRIEAQPDDATPTSYDAIAHALRQPLNENLPTDFARHVANRARQRASINMYFELVLSLTLCGVLVLMLGGLVMYFGAGWLKLAQSNLPLRAIANEWIVALIACLLVFNLISKLLDVRGRAAH